MYQVQNVNLKLYILIKLHFYSKVYVLNPLINSGLLFTHLKRLNQNKKWEKMCAP